MDAERKRQRSWWPWVATLVVAVPCCGSCIGFEWKLSEGREFCGSIAVGEPVEAVVSRAVEAGFVPDAEGKAGPGTRYLRRPVAPFCEFLCFMDHDGARVTKTQGTLGGLCT